MVFSDSCHGLAEIIKGKDSICSKKRSPELVLVKICLAIQAMGHGENSD